jgi:pimeloyl-ACP methyl ester carboxylesterase
MGGKVAMQFACLYPEKVEKLIVADIGPKYYPQHHQTILEGLSAIDFSKKPSRQEADETLANFIKDVSTRQFLLKSLYWETQGQLAFRFNLKVFVEKIEEVGKALSPELHYDEPTLFLRGDKSNYILDSDWVAIQLQFPNAQLETISNAGHWLHAENPKDFYSYVLDFIK